MQLKQQVELTRLLMDTAVGTLSGRSRDGGMAALPTGPSALMINGCAEQVYEFT